MDRVHICETSVGLDELSRSKQRSNVEVARVLARAGRFSVFEATSTPAIARTLTRIRELGWFEFEPQGFPWTKVTLTETGKDELAKADR